MIDSLASGGVVGGAMALLSHVTNGLTGWLQAKTEMKKRELEMKHEQAMFPLKLEASKEENAWRGFIASQEAAKDSVNDTTPAYATAVLTLTRPALTLLLLGSAVALVAYQPPTSKEELAKQVLELAGIATGWWFGNRQLGKR